jgi:hypothetical protein
VAADNSDFHAAMQAITSASRMSKINDIRELKQQVAHEASTLRRT